MERSDITRQTPRKLSAWMDLLCSFDFCFTQTSFNRPVFPSGWPVFIFKSPTQQFTIDFIIGWDSHTKPSISPTSSALRIKNKCRHHNPIYCALRPSNIVTCYETIIPFNRSICFRYYTLGEKLCSCCLLYTSPSPRDRG